MDKGKSVFVTALIAVMLAVIDTGLYILYFPGFVILTGVLAVCGFFHGAHDLYLWLCKTEKSKAPLTPPVIVQQDNELFDWKKEESPFTERGKYDALIEEISGYKI